MSERTQKMTKYLRIKEVVEKLSVGKSTIYAWIKQGRFPEPIRITQYCAVWKDADIDEWVRSKQ